MKIGLMALGLIVAGSVAAMAMSALDGMGEPHCWRYKITVNINTPEGLKSGAAVRKACMTPFEGYNPSIADFKESVLGEAVIVDLGQRGIIFARFSASEAIFDISKSFEGPKLFSQEGIEYYASLEAGLKAPLPEEQYPKLLAFEDLKDPTSIKMVLGNIYDAEKKKYVPVNNFEKYFGKGVELKNITIETTDELINWKVRDLLPWIDEYYGKQLDGARHNYSGAENPIANRYSAGSFAPTKEMQNER